MGEWINDILMRFFLMLCIFMAAAKILWRMAGQSAAGQAGREATKAAGKHFAAEMFRKMLSK